MHTLIINLGLRSIRGIIFDERGKKIDQEWLPIRTTLTGPRVEQDPNEWWALMVRVIHRLLERTPTTSEIRYISVTSPSSCLVVLGNDGEVLMPAMMVADKRATTQARELQENPELSGMFDNANHLREASYMWPKLMWLQKNHPAIMRKAVTFMNANDYLTYRLTGNAVTDPLNAEKFYYDSDRAEYPTKLMEYFSLGNELFPIVQPIGSDIGPLISKVGTELGLSPHTRVTLATYDAICAFWGTGISVEGEACNVSGTSLSFRVLSKNPARRNDSGILSQYYAPHDYYVVGGSNNLEGGILEWARNCLYVENLNSGPDYVYTLMQDEAMESSVGARGLTFVPYLIGERVPIWDPDARGVFFGIERSHRRADFIRSILESTGYMTLNIIRAIEDSGIPVNSVRMSGGVAKLPYVCKLRADITGRPVHVLAEHETAALGAFMVVNNSAGLSNGISSLAKIAQISATYQPDPERHQQYLQFRELFDDVYESLKPTFNRRTDLMQHLLPGEKSTIDNL